MFFRDDDLKNGNENKDIVLENKEDDLGASPPIGTISLLERSIFGFDYQFVSADEYQCEFVFAISLNIV